MSAATTIAPAEPNTVNCSSTRTPIDVVIGPPGRPTGGEEHRPDESESAQPAVQDHALGEPDSQPAHRALDDERTEVGGEVDGTRADR